MGEMGELKGEHCRKKRIKAENEGFIHKQKKQKEYKGNQPESGAK